MLVTCSRLTPGADHFGSASSTVHAMSEANLAYRAAGLLYKHAFPIYRMAYGTYKTITDRAERSMIQSSVGPGDIVVDVGANIGYYSRYLSRLVGPDGRVVAFEPSEQNFRRLVESTRSLEIVEPVQAAVGNVTGTLDLHESDDLNVDHRTYDTGGLRNVVQVPSYRLDDFFPSGQRVDFVKMDIQGFEYQAIRGMAGLLRDNHEVAVLLEYWPLGLLTAGTEPNELLELLRGLGFELRFPHRNEWTRDEPKDLGFGPTDYTNIFAAR